MCEGELSLAALPKTNLRLRVFGREESGYHGIETLFLRLALADTVRIREGPAGTGLGLRVEPHEGVEPGSVPEGPDNLCIRAAEAYLEAAGREGIDSSTDVEIHLAKRIPAGSGLGGGSADAAAVLRLMNELAGRALSAQRLLRIAGELGSDVPFGLLPGPAALAWGRGHRILPLRPPPERPALVVLPGIGIPTEEAYRWLDEDRTEDQEDIEEAVTSPAAALPPPDELRRWETLEEVAVNDFESSVYRRHPAIREARDAAAPEATVALLSGSGDAVVGIYPDAEARDRAARAVVEECGFRVVRTRTVSSPAAPIADRWPLV